MERHLHIHTPGDVILPILDDLELPEGASVLRHGDSYREWGEPLKEDEPHPEHVVLQVPSSLTEPFLSTLVERGIPVDVSLDDDWASIITWGHTNHPGWSNRYPRRNS